MKKKLVSIGLALTLCLSLLPSTILAAGNGLSYRMLEEVSDDQWEESAVLKTDSLDLVTTGEAHIALYDGDTLVDLFADGADAKAVTISDNLDVSLLTKKVGGVSTAIKTGYYDVSFNEIDDDRNGTIEYDGKILTIKPVAPEYGFYTDAACELSSLVEDYTVTPGQATILYFCSKGKDYTDFSFALDNKPLTDKLGTYELTADQTAVRITVNADKSGTLEALYNGETVAELELDEDNSTQTPNFVLCTKEDGKNFDETDSTLDLKQSQQTLSLYLVNVDEEAVKIKDVVWTQKSGPAGALTCTTKSIDNDATEIVLTRSTNDAFSGTLTVTKGTSFSVSVNISFAGAVQADPTLAGLRYRLMTGKEGTLGPYSGPGEPLKLTYAESVYAALYVNGIPVEKPDELESKGVDIDTDRKYDTYGVLCISPERTTSGMISLDVGGGVTYTLPVEIEVPEVGFFSMNQQAVEFYLTELDILNENTVVYFFGAEQGDHVQFSTAPADDDPDKAAKAGILTLSPTQVPVADGSSIEVTLTDCAASAEDYGKRGMAVCVSLNGEKAEPFFNVKRSNNYGTVREYAFYSLENGQYDLMDNVEFRGDTLSETIYLRKGSGVKFTQAEMDALDFSFEVDGVTQNSVSLSWKLTDDGAIAVAVQLANDRNISGMINVEDANGEDVAYLELEFAQGVKPGRAGRLAFAINSPNDENWYRIGFASGETSASELYPTYISDWSRNSKLNNEEAEEDAFYMAVTLNDDVGPRIQPDIYRDYIKSVTFSILDAGADTEMPAIEASVRNSIYDMVTVYTYLKNAGTWKLRADVEFTQPVWIGDDDESILSNTLQIDLEFCRELVREIEVDLRDPDNCVDPTKGKQLNALETVQAYIDLLNDQAGVDVLKDFWDENDHEDWADLLKNEDAELWFTLPAERYESCLEAGELLRQVGVIGTTDSNGNATTIRGSVYRTECDPDSHTLALSDLHLEGNGKNNLYLDGTETLFNYGVYTSGPNIEFEGCTFEDYYAAVWDSPLGKRPGDQLSLYGGNKNTFRNNHYAVYTDSRKMDGTANKPAMMRSTFEGNDFGLYIVSLAEKGYKYNLKFCKFIDNGTDIYYAYTHKVFFPSNYFGETINGQVTSRDPIVAGETLRVIVDKWIDADGNVIRQYADIATKDLVILYPILMDANFDEDKPRLGVGRSTTGFEMLMDDAGDLQMHPDSLIGRENALSIAMVDQDTSNETAEEGEVVGNTTVLATWTIEAK